jgi:hypothetical protein
MAPKIDKPIALGNHRRPESATSVVVHELFRVDQSPQQIFQGGSFFLWSLSLFEVLCDKLQFLGRWHSGVREQIDVPDFLLSRFCRVGGKRRGAADR